MSETLPERRKPGRPKKHYLTTKVKQLILKMAQEGYSVQKMCDWLEIGMSTWYRWMHAHPDFRRRVKEACYEHELEFHAEINRRARKSDAVLMFLAERKYGYTKTETKRHIFQSEENPPHLVENEPGEITDGGPIIINFDEAPEYDLSKYDDRQIIDGDVLEDAEDVV